MQGGQRRGPINGLDPSIYTGGLPNLVVMQREPNPTDYQEFVLGHWWIVPAEYSDTGSGEVWVLVSKRYGIATWKRLHGGSSPGNNFVLGNQYFTTPGAGTYTPTIGMLQCYVECVGGGGSGGSIVGTMQSGVCYAGGAGGYCAKLFTAEQIGTSQSFIVGAGGSQSSAGANTTFGSFLTANGGGYGLIYGDSVYDNIPNGIGGTSSGGDINIDGGTGYFSQPFPSVAIIPVGNGGSSYFASGGRPLPAINSSTTVTGISGKFGSGGGGLVFSYGGGESVHMYGGNGGDGLIKITEYFA